MHGAIGGGHDQSRQLGDSGKADRFTASTAKAIGQSERKEIYLELHPETGAGSAQAAGMNRSVGNNAVAKLAATFAIKTTANLVTVSSFSANTGRDRERMARFRMTEEGQRGLRRQKWSPNQRCAPKDGSEEDEGASPLPELKRASLGAMDGQGKARPTEAGRRTRQGLIIGRHTRPRSRPAYRPVPACCRPPRPAVGWQSTFSARQYRALGPSQRPARRASEPLPCHSRT